MWLILVQESCTGSSFHNDACLVGWTVLCVSTLISDGVRFLGPIKRWIPIAFVMLILRLVYLPLDSQDVVGHSVQYLDVFRGQFPTIGDSTFYPALQIVWFLFGKSLLER